jgi:hypothetical protein
VRCDVMQLHLRHRHGVVGRLVVLAIVGHIQPALVLAHVLGTPAQVADGTMHCWEVLLCFAALG